MSCRTSIHIIPRKIPHPSQDAKSQSQKLAATKFFNLQFPVSNHPPGVAADL